MQPLFRLIETKFTELDKIDLFDFIIETINSPLTEFLIKEQVELNLVEIKQEFRKVVPHVNRTYHLWFESVMFLKNKLPIISFSCDFDWISLKQVKQIQSTPKFKLTTSYRWDECTMYETETKLQFPKAYFYISGILVNNGNSWMLNSKIIEEDKISFNKFKFKQ